MHAPSLPSTRATALAKGWASTKRTTGRRMLSSMATDSKKQRKKASYIFIKRNDPRHPKVVPEVLLNLLSLGTDKRPRAAPRRQFTTPTRQRGKEARTHSTLADENNSGAATIQSDPVPRASSMMRRRLPPIPCQEKTEEHTQTTTPTDTPSEARSQTIRHIFLVPSRARSLSPIYDSHDQPLQPYPIEDPNNSSNGHKCGHDTMIDIVVEQLQGYKIQF